MAQICVVAKSENDFAKLLQLCLMIVPLTSLLEARQDVMQRRTVAMWFDVDHFGRQANLMGANWCRAGKLDL